MNKIKLTSKQFFAVVFLMCGLMKNILFLFREIRIRPFIGKLTLAAMLVLSVIAHVSAQSGNPAAIDIKEFSFTPSIIDTTNSSQTVTITVRVTDTERNVTGVSVSFRSPIGNQYVGVGLLNVDRISGNARDGVYRKTAIFPQYSGAGTWKINFIYAFDGINYRAFGTSEIAARGFATELQVISNNEDIIPPEISDFSLSPSVINTADGAQDVTITFRVKDATSGIPPYGSIRVFLFRPEDDYWEGDGFIIEPNISNRISGDDKDGVYKVVHRFSQWTPSGIYNVSIEALDSVGLYMSWSYFALAARGYPSRLGVNTPVAPTAARVRLFDFDGDGKADVSVFRPTDRIWYLNQSTQGFSATQFGLSTDKIVPADYDGDGKTDIAVYRDGTWFVQRSTTGFLGLAFGAATDIPVPADYDGDGRAEIAVFRPSDGVWYIYNLTTNQFTGFPFGQAGDVPLAADYDNDGRADIAVFRNGTWYLLQSTNGFTGIQFGFATDLPVPADYDGDGKTDLAVFRPSNGTWYLQRSRDGFTAIAFGLGTDLPVPADYDGDEKTDIAVFRNGTWYIQRSQSGFTGVAFGEATDKPVPNAFIP